MSSYHLTYISAISGRNILHAFIQWTWSKYLHKHPCILNCGGLRIEVEPVPVPIEKHVEKGHVTHVESNGSTKSAVQM